MTTSDNLAVVDVPYEIPVWDAVGYGDGKSVQVAIGNGGLSPGGIRLKIPVKTRFRVAWGEDYIRIAIWMPVARGPHDELKKQLRMMDHSKDGIFKFISVLRPDTERVLDAFFFQKGPKIPLSQKSLRGMGIGSKRISTALRELVVADRLRYEPMNGYYLAGVRPVLGKPVRMCMDGRWFTARSKVSPNGHPLH